MTDFFYVVVANAPAGDVGGGEVREEEGESREGERKKGQREGSATHMSPTERSVGLAGQLKRCGTEWQGSAHSGHSGEGSAPMRCR